MNTIDPAGARFRKADLQIHTPNSKDYQYDQKKTVTGEDIVKEALSKGLEIIAITDHNDIGFIEEVRNAARGKNIYVFPGIEVTTPDGHLVTIFDLDYPINKLGDFLAQIGITSDKRGKKEALADGFEKVLDKVTEFGGLAFAAHANSSNGLLKHPKGQYKMRLYKRHDLMALELKNREDIEKYSKGLIPKYPPKACIQNSDAHSLEEIGTKFTYLKMDHVSFEGIKQTLIDYPVKIKYEWEDIELRFPSIKNFSVSQGFFSGESFDFNKSLNCLIGGKGTGKSTVIELMRFCFDDISRFDEIREDTLSKAEKLVKHGGVVKVVLEDYDGEEYVIRREIVEDVEDHPPLVTNLEGDEVPIPFKPVFFSQGEVVRFTSSTIAQLELIDRYLDLSEENQIERECTDKLLTNAAKIIELRDELHGLKEILLDPDTGQLATKTKYRKLEKDLKVPIIAEFPMWEAEERFIEQTGEGLESFKDQVDESLDGIDVDAFFPTPIDTTSPNYKMLMTLTEASDKISLFLDKIKEYSEKKMPIKLKDIETVKESWNPLYEKKSEEYDIILEELEEEDINEAQRRLRDLKRKSETLDKTAKEIKTKEKELKNIYKERTELVKKLQKIRNQRYRKRAAKANEWEEIFEGRIKIDIQSSGNKKKYQQELEDLLHGSYITTKDIIRIASSLTPDELVDAILENQYQFIADQSGIKIDNATKAVEFASSQERELYELQSVEVEDLPVISFEVEPGRHKPLNELSVGTKSTVIVSIAMVEGNVPLIIDQPEDSLDTQFIYNHIVQKIRDEKMKRQFVFATYNPNILVAGDAELTYVLDASADRGEIKSSGGIDKLDTNQLVLLHLEGGREAFSLRTKKYLDKSQ